MLPLRVRVDLGAMAINGYFAFPKSPRLQPRLSDDLMSYPGHLTKCSWCILQPQPSGLWREREKERDRERKRERKKRKRKTTAFLTKL